MDERKDHIEIKNGKELRAAVRRAKIILIQPRLGTNEIWVKISKKEATLFIKDIGDTETPRDFEMGTDSFGDIENGTLHLG